MKTKTITVKTNEENPEPTEIIAQAIIDIAAGMKKINEGRLGRHALIVLIKDRSGVSQTNIKLVLDAITDLKRAYIRDLPKKS